MTIEVPEALADYVDETSARHREQIWKMHEKDFAEHRIEEQQPGLWYCARPGTGILHFYVAFLPHAILLYGDIGDMLLRPGWKRGLGWLRGAAKNREYLGYLFSKVPYKQQRRVFMPGDVIAALQQSIDPDMEIQKACDEWTALDEWADRIDCEDPQSSWYAAASAAGLDCEWFSSFDDFDAEMYWCGYALCWFVKEWERRFGGSDGG